MLRGYLDNRQQLVQSAGNKWEFKKIKCGAPRRKMKINYIWMGIKLNSLVLNDEIKMVIESIWGKIFGGS